MKVTDFPTNSNRITSFVKQEPDAGFSHLLNLADKGTSGDDYYRQHQNQLQQSALSFKPFLTKERLPLPLDSENALVLKKSSTAVHVEVDSAHTQHTAQTSLKLELQISEKNPQFLIEALIKDMESMMTSWVSLPEVIVKSTPQPLPIVQHIKQTVVPPYRSFKNHQLFIHDKSVELTLNTTQLSKQQTYELQNFIKQWLAKKGYCLKQLIINGVKQ